MIDFRYHVVSIVAVFLALALGLFIGSTSLRGTVASDLNRRTASLAGENRSLNGQIGDLKSQVREAQRFDTALEPFTVGDVLAGQSVVLVSAPGADDGIRRQLSDVLGLAGATVTGDVQLQNNIMDSQQSSFLESLVARFAIPGFTASGNGPKRALSLLADVLGTRPQGHPVSPAAADRVLSAFSAGKLIKVAGGSAHPASLVVLLAPAPPPADADPTVVADQQSALLSFAGDLDHDAVGAVVAGPAVAAGPGGLVTAVRGDNVLSASVSTVDGADAPSGLIATVFALAEQARGGTGDYGPGSSAPLPTPSSGP